MERILIVDDDGEIAENLKALLERENFYVKTAAARQQALALLSGEPFDLALIDLSLPDGSGYTLCTALKQKWQAGVIFLTAADDEDSIVTGFGLGGDDYVVKPFKPMELVCRIRSVLRRTGAGPAERRAGSLRIDMLRASVTKNGEKLPLSALEYRLLLLLAEHQGQVLSRNRLLEEIWDTAGDYVNDNTLTVYMKRLREKIEDDPANPTLLKTVRGLGYMLGE